MIQIEVNVVFIEQISALLAVPQYVVYETISCLRHAYYRRIIYRITMESKGLKQKQTNLQSKKESSQNLPQTEKEPQNAVSSSPKIDQMSQKNEVIEEIVQVQQKKQQRKDNKKNSGVLSSSEDSKIQGKFCQKAQEMSLEMVTKRSDDKQFVDWKVGQIKSGCFVFQETDKKGAKEQPKVMKTYLKVPENKIRASASTNRLQIAMTNKKNQGKQVPKHHIVLDLAKNKQIKTIFLHFCKQNYISSIKSTLFEQKQKSMQQMSLNKWMVFCKEFDILNSLFLIKQDTKELKALDLQSSNVRELVKVKKIKQIQDLLVKIFKKAATRDHTTMQFEHFIDAIKLLAKDFAPLYGHQSEGLDRFSRQILHSDNQKECFKKLANLKITFGTPKILYQKVTMPAQLCKSRFEKSIQKENKQSQGKLRTMHRDLSHAKVNNVVYQARKDLLLKNQSKTLTLGAKIGTRLAQLNENYTKNSPKTKKNKLYQFFQASHDDILDTYFECETINRQASVRPSK